MATNKPEKVTHNVDTQFDKTHEIYRIFGLLIEQLIARRDYLIQKAIQLREEHSTDEISRITSMQELEKVQQKFDDISLKSNRNSPVHLEAREVYRQGIQKLEASNKPTHPLFHYPTLSRLQSLISEFGEVVEWEVPEYSLKKAPVLATGKKGKGAKELDARGLAIDEPNQLIYIADCLNSRIQVVSFQGEFLKRFGKDHLISPWGIAVTDEHLFVTDSSHHSLLQFRKNNMEFLNKTGTLGTKEGQLRNPRGLSVDTNGDVFVAEYMNHRVSVFTKRLQFKVSIANSQLFYPQDVKLTKDCLIVLDRSPKCVLFFSRAGVLQRFCISLGEARDVNQPFFFCLDHAENIIISDRDGHVIKIFSKSGDLIHTIGREGEGIGEFFNPYGIEVSYSGNIFVLSNNLKFSLQCF